MGRWRLSHMVRNQLSGKGLCNIIYSVMNSKIDQSKIGKPNLKIIKKNFTDTFLQTLQIIFNYMLKSF